MIISRTHRIGPTGSRLDCGTSILAHMSKTAQPNVGDRIGKIETQHGGTVAYAAGENDSNEACSTK